MAISCHFGVSIANFEQEKTDQALFFTANLHWADRCPHRVENVQFVQNEIFHLYNLFHPNCSEVYKTSIRKFNIRLIVKASQHHAIYI